MKDDDEYVEPLKVIEENSPTATEIEETKPLKKRNYDEAFSG